MNYGLNLAASGALTSLYRMDVLANNLANMSTPGFKPDLPAIQQRNPERIEDNLSLPSNKLLERLGGGVFAAANRTSFEQGPLARTGNPLDLAVEGPGFFVLRDESNSGADRYRLTRDGRFLRDKSGRMVSATSGLPLMDTQNRPITLRDDSQVQIGADGVVRQNGEAIAEIQLKDIKDTRRLKKLGQSLFTAPSDLMNSRSRAAGEIRQQSIEGSAVDPILATLAIGEAQKAAEANTRMMVAHDHLMDRAINTLGRTA